MTNTCRVLLIEDDREEARSIEKACCPDPETAAIDVVSNGVDAEDALREREYDLVICDLALPRDRVVVAVANGGDRHHRPPDGLTQRVDVASRRVAFEEEHDDRPIEHQDGGGQQEAFEVASAKQGSDQPETEDDP